MLGNKLHKRLFGTEYKPQPKQPAQASQVQKVIEFKKPTKESSLADLRNNNALRIPKGCANKILQHKQANAFILFLELKGLFISSVILPDNGKLPYERVHRFTGESVTTVRNRFRELKKLGLVTLDNSQIILSSFKEFRRVLGITCKRTYKLANNGDTKKTLRFLSIYENLERQKFVMRKKIFQREILEQKAVRQLDLINHTSSKYAKGCKLKFESFFITNRCKDRYLETRHQIRKFRKHFDKSFDFYVNKYQRIYNAHIQQTLNGLSDKRTFPLINPEITLSCNGTARVCGLTSKASGHRIQSELRGMNLLHAQPTYIEIPEGSSAIYESKIGARSDVYGYRYPTRREGMKMLYYRTCTNQLSLFIEKLQYQKPLKPAPIL